VAARSIGIPVNTVRMTATVLGASLAAAGGAHLTLYFPGIWSEGISGGQGLMAVALVIFARWSPLRCMAAALLFGGAQALGPSLQAVGQSGYYHLFNASPYLLTLVLMVATCSRYGGISGAPGALGRNA
jgi:simple sugar transport system permease protein